ncbi:aminoglycoside phosphotransferase family protein [Microlunatus elymi]|uniref:Aminoglycoside phosphotransferase family protein n=1 Tax=Microlunatus elymi TaxID=2596828 RepID=A0A516PUZ0_9ACTN|nr:phosphotransferase [Microlunatus elymi]QDP94950.1 aminoglycoside phosphotransferase family protein [Microlunatus elymi]
MSEQRRISVRGDSVERPRKPWTPTIQSLLRHLRRTGQPVPEPLGYDDEHEFVGLVVGDAGDAAWQHQLQTAGVRSAGALLRRIHDAGVTWRRPVDAVWSVPAGQDEVICHGDPQPANFAWTNGRAVGLFDWDAARPGSRLEDVAYALLWLVPVGVEKAELERRGFGSMPDRRARAEAFLDGYGWRDSINVVEVALARHRQAIDEVVVLGRQGHQPHADWIAAGWPERWRSGLARMRSLSDGFDPVIPAR